LINEKDVPYTGVKLSWGGDGPALAGMVKDRDRNALANTYDPTNDYIILRITSGFGTYGNRTVVVYKDENPIPVLQIDNAATGHGQLAQGFGFGVEGWPNATTPEEVEVWFDWLVWTNAGMFAPSEEKGCIEDPDHPGQPLISLVPAGACELPDGSCEEMFESACLDQNGTFQGRGTTCYAYEELSIDLGNPDVPDGIVHIQVADGDTIPTTMNGRSCRQNVSPDEDFYFYFGVADSYAYQGSKPDLYITIDYFDIGSGYLRLQYDSSDTTPFPNDIYKDGGAVQLTGTHTWKTHVFHVTDAYFGNRQNGGADFRIDGGNRTFYLDAVAVGTLPGIPEIDLDTTTFDHSIYRTHELQKQDAFAVSNSGGRILNYSIIEDAQWLSILPSSGTCLPGEPNDITISYSTAGLSSGNYTATITVQDPAASNSPQVVTVHLEIKVTGDMDGDNDVDQTDFGYFQNCFSGIGQEYEPNCAYADFDLDEDVDQIDFSLFQDCMSGANLVPDC